MAPTSTTTCPKSSRRFVIVWLAAVVLAAGVAFPLCTLGTLNWFDKREYFWISQLYQRKAHALAKRDEPTLIIYGGSATTFGVDAELIEKTLKIPTINFASHGVLGLDYQIAQIKHSARPRDTVLFIPELEAYGDTETPSAGLREYAFSYDRSYLLSMAPAQALRLLFLSPFSDYSDSVTRWSIKLSTEGEGDMYEKRHGYSYIDLGPNGDLRSLAPSKGDVAPLPFPNHFSAHAKKSLVALSRWCGRHQIALSLTWPNRVEAPMEARQDQFRIHVRVANFCDEEHIPIIGTPEESVYPKELFIDSVYHLNELGRRIRTEKLIAHLREMCGKSARPNGPRTICLFGARTPLANQLDIFAASENVDYKYLSETPLNHPDCLTPDDLPALLRDGTRLVCLDDVTEALAAKADLHSVEIKRSEASFADWVRRYPQHVFALSLVGTEESPVKDTGNLPKYFAQFFAEKGFRIGLIGTGKFNDVHRIASNSEMTRWSKTRHSPLKGLMRFNFQVGLRSGPASIFTKAYPPIVVEGDGLADLTPGLAVTVIDPEREIVISRATFQDRPLLEWKLRQLVPSKSESAPAPPTLQK